MASLTWWTWVSVNSRSWWWTGRPGMLRFMGSQRVGHDWATELNWRSMALLTSWFWTSCLQNCEEIHFCCFKPPVLCLITQLSDSLRPHGLQPARLLCPWGYSRQENWSGLPCHPPGVLPNPGIEPRSPVLQADSLPSEPPGNPLSHLLCGSLLWQPQGTNIQSLPYVDLEKARGSIFVVSVLMVQVWVIRLSNLVCKSHSDFCAHMRYLMKTNKNENK